MIINANFLPLQWSFEGVHCCILSWGSIWSVDLQQGQTLLQRQLFRFHRYRLIVWQWTRWTKSPRLWMFQILTAKIWFLWSLVQCSKGSIWVCGFVGVSILHIQFLFNSSHSIPPPTNSSQFLIELVKNRWSFVDFSWWRKMLITAISSIYQNRSEIMQVQMTKIWCHWELALCLLTNLKDPPGHNF